jgi:hypothetical protein
VLGSEVGWLNWLERCNVEIFRPSLYLRSFIHHHTITICNFKLFICFLSEVLTYADMLLPSYEDK